MQCEHYYMFPQNTYILLINSPQQAAAVHAPLSFVVLHRWPMFKAFTALSVNVNIFQFSYISVFALVRVVGTKNCIDLGLTVLADLITCIDNSLH